MPRIKKTNQGHLHHEKSHRLELCGYHVGDFVILNAHTSCDYIVKIIDLWTTTTTTTDSNDEETQIIPMCTTKYYYATSDIPAPFACKIPTSCVENEVFLSNFTADNALDTIREKCVVINVPLEMPPLNSILKTTTELCPIYRCRYQFSPWNAATPFSSILAMSMPSEKMMHVSKDSAGKKTKDKCVSLGDDHQAEIFPLVVARQSDVTRESDQSVQMWSCTSVPDLAIEAFLFLARCLQLSVGNVICVWQKELREQVPCIVLEHLPRGYLRVRFGDDSGEDTVHSQFVRGIILDEMWLEILYSCEFHYPRALVKVASTLVAKTQEWKDQLNPKNKSASVIKRAAVQRKESSPKKESSSAMSVKKKSPAKKKLSAKKEPTANKKSPKKKVSAKESQAIKKRTTGRLRQASTRALRNIVSTVK